MSSRLTFVPAAYPFRPLLTLIRDEEGRVLKRTVTLELAQEAREAFNRLLDPFALSWDVLGPQLNETFPDLGVWPWAVVAFRKEFRLMGHACSLRKSPLDYSLSSYSLCADPKPQGSGIPRVSLALIQRKEVLEDLGQRSLLFKGAWDLVRDAGNQTRWLVLPPDPPEPWLESLSKEDDRLYRTMLKG